MFKNKAHEKEVQELKDKIIELETLNDVKDCLHETLREQIDILLAQFQAIKSSIDEIITLVDAQNNLKEALLKD